MTTRNALAPYYDMGGYEPQQVPRSDVLAQRASLLPIGINTYGGAEWAVPGMLMDGWNAVWNAGDAAARGDWQGAGHAGAEAAGLAMVGAMPFAQRSAVGMFGGKLPRSQSAADKMTDELRQGLSVFHAQEGPPRPPPPVSATASADPSGDLDAFIRQGFSNYKPTSVAQSIPENALSPQGIRAFHGSPHDDGNWVTAYRGQGKPLGENQSFRPESYFTDNPKVASAFAENRVPKPIEVERTRTLPERTGIAGLWDRMTGAPLRTETYKSIETPSWSYDRSKDGAAVHPVRINTEGYQVIDWPSYNRNHKKYQNLDYGKYPSDEFWDWHAHEAIDAAKKSGAPGVVIKNVREERIPSQLHDQIIPLNKRQNGDPSVVGLYDGKTLFGLPISVAISLYGMDAVSQAMNSGQVPENALAQ